MCKSGKALALWVCKDVKSLLTWESMLLHVMCPATHLVKDQHEQFASLCCSEEENDSAFHGHKILCEAVNSPQDRPKHGNGDECEGIGGHSNAVGR